MNYAPKPRKSIYANAGSVLSSRSLLGDDLWMGYLVSVGAAEFRSKFVADVGVSKDIVVSSARS